MSFLPYSRIIIKSSYKKKKKKHTLQLPVDVDQGEVQQWFLFYFAL